MAPVPTPTVETKYHNPFSIVIAETGLLGHAAWKDQLTDLVMSLRKNDPAAGPMTAWRSKPNFHEARHPSINWLVRKTCRAAIDHIHNMTETREGVDVHLGGCRAMVMEPGQWLPPDTEISTCSGLFCISGPQGTGDRDSELFEPRLTLYNPVAAADKLGHQASFDLRLREGAIYLFPGYLTRTLTPHRLADPVVCAAFSLTLL